MPSITTPLSGAVTAQLIDSQTPAPTAEQAARKSEAKREENASGVNPGAAGTAKLFSTDALAAMTPQDAIAHLIALSGQLDIAQTPPSNSHDAAALFARLADAIAPDQVPNAADIGKPFDPDLPTPQRQTLLLLPDNLTAKLTAAEQLSRDPRFADLPTPQQQRVALIKEFQKIAWAAAETQTQPATAQAPLPAEIAQKAAKIAPELALALKQFSTGFDKGKTDKKGHAAEIDRESAVEIPSPELVKMEGAAQAILRDMVSAVQGHAQQSADSLPLNGDVEELMIMVMMRGGQIDSDALRDQMNELAGANKRKASLRETKTKMKADVARLNSELRDEYAKGLGDGDIAKSITFDQYTSVRKALWNQSATDTNGDPIYKAAQLLRPVVLPAWIKTGQMSTGDTAATHLPGGAGFGLHKEVDDGMQQVWAHVGKPGGDYEGWLQSLGMKYPTTTQEAIDNLLLAQTTMQNTQYPPVELNKAAPVTDADLTSGAPSIQDLIGQCIARQLVCAATGGDPDKPNVMEALEKRLSGGFANNKAQADYTSLYAQVQDTMTKGLKSVRELIASTGTKPGIDIAILSGSGGFNVVDSNGSFVQPQDAASKSFLALVEKAMYPSEVLGTNTGDDELMAGLNKMAQATLKGAPTGAGVVANGDGPPVKLDADILATEGYVDQVVKGSGGYWQWLQQNDVTGAKARAQEQAAEQQRAQQEAAAAKDANAALANSGFDSSGSLEEYGAFTQSVDDKMTSLGELTDTMQMRVQMAMDRRAKMFETLSNLLAKMTSTSKTLAENLK